MKVAVSYKHLAAGAAVVIILLGGYSYTQQQKIDRMKQENAALADSVDQLNTNISQLRSTVDDLNQDLSSAERQLSTTEQEFDSYRDSAVVTGMIDSWGISSDTTGDERTFRVSLVNLGNDQATDISVFCATAPRGTDDYKYGFIGDANNLAGNAGNLIEYRYTPNETLVDGATLDDAIAECMAVDCDNCRTPDTDNTLYDSLYEYYQSEEFSSESPRAET